MGQPHRRRHRNTSRLNNDNSIPSCPWVTPSQSPEHRPQPDQPHSLHAGLYDDFWIVFIRLVSGEHVVIGGMMAILLRNMLFKEALSSGWQQRNRVPGYRMPTANDERSKFRLFYPGEVSRASLARTFNDRFVTRNNCGFIKAPEIELSDRMIHNAFHSEDL